MPVMTVFKREIERMGRRPIYLMMLIVVPLACAVFFMALLSEGLPTRTPVAVVDMDHSALSRQVTRSLNAAETIDIVCDLESFSEAMDHVRHGEIFGFFVIPSQFEKNAIAGNEPTLEYYSNMTFFVPGTLSFKGFKTISVTTSGGLATAKLTSLGLDPTQISPLVQPVKIDTVCVGNPWLNYSYYLTPSFTFALVSLLIMIMTAFSITVEIKHGTSPRWLESAHGNMWLALAGKLLPHTAVWILVCFAIEAMMVGFEHFPLNGSLGWMLLAIVLFVIAAQSFAVFVCCLLPNPRLSLSVVSLLGVLTFSYAGFSFPVENMYGAIAIFSYLAPARYLFLIYVNTVLNGLDIYYVRYLMAALLVFPLVAMLFTRRLKKACLNPVYVP